MAGEKEVQDSERMRLADRAGALSADVMPLLRVLAPQASETVLQAACSEVVSAIMSYELRSRASEAEPLREQRQDLVRMRKALQKCLDVLEPQPSRFGALRRMQTAQLNQNGVNGGIRELRQHLVSAISASDAALEELKGKPGHGANEDLAELAAKLRWTLAMTLGVRPVMKPDSLRRSVDQGKSANYSQLLRLALSLAGMEPKDDLQYLLEKGRERLRDQGVPIFDQHFSDDYPAGVALLGYGKFDTK